MMQLNSAAPSSCPPRRFSDPVTGSLRRRLTILFLAPALAAAGYLPGAMATAVPAHAAAGFDASSAEAQLVADINADRASNGLGPLLVNPALSSIARGQTISVCGQLVHGRSQDMVERNYFSHQVPPCGQQVFSILSPNGISWSNAGENIGWNSYSPQTVSVDQVSSQFMASAGHRANILGSFNQVGVGAFSGTIQGYPGAIMYTEIFTMGPPPAAAPPTAALVPPSAGDLYGAERNGTSSGKVEVHAVSQAAGYRSFVAHAASPFAATTSDEWQFQFAPIGGDGQPDLVGIHFRNTQSGMVEVHALSAASNYTSWVLHTATALNTMNSGNPYQFTFGSLDGDHRSDLYVIAVTGTSTGLVEVHALSEASNYGGWILHSTSAYATVNPAQWQFRIGDRAGSGDLIGIAHGATSSGRTEVHVLTRATNYQGFSVHAATPLGLTTDSQWAYAVGDRDHDGVPDVFAVEMNGTSSNTTEVHVLGGSSNFNGWIEHAATGLQTTSASGWQFSVR
jgi:uncharacterized protein YkwD